MALHDDLLDLGIRLVGPPAPVAPVASQTSPSAAAAPAAPAMRLPIGQPLLPTRLSTPT